MERYPEAQAPPAPKRIKEAISADLDGALRYLPYAVDGDHIGIGSPEGVLEIDRNDNDILGPSDISGVKIGLITGLRLWRYDDPGADDLAVLESWR